MRITRLRTRRFSQVRSRFLTLCGSSVKRRPCLSSTVDLNRSQQERLSKHVTLVPAHGGLHPQLQKATGPLAHPAEIMVVIDADILVTRPLTPLFEDAANGRLVVFEDDRFPARFFPEWSSLGLGIPTRQPYVNSGLLIFSSATASELLPEFVEQQEQLDPTSAQFGGADMSSPFCFPDQDILNAMLCTRYDGMAVRVERRLAPFPPFPGVQVADGSRLACTYADGVVPYVLHHVNEKPWLTRMNANPYSKLFTRAVTSPGAPLRLGVRDLPLRLSRSRLAPIDRWRVSIQLAAHHRLRGKLGLRPAIGRGVHRIRRRGDEVTDRSA